MSFPDAVGIVRFFRRFASVRYVDLCLIAIFVENIYRAW